MGSSTLTSRETKSGSPPEGQPLLWRRTRSTSSSASSLSTSSSTPSPFPSHNFHSSFAIPFSWEHLPGIPKNPNKTPKSHPDPLLPLPPLLRSNSDTPRKKRSDSGSAAVDPFAVALVECAKDSPARNELEEFFRKGKAAAIGRRREIAPSISDRFGFFDLYGSCKATCSVSESTISIPRHIHRTG